MSGSSYYLDLPTSSSSSRPSKRKRGSGSPEVGRASTSGRAAAAAAEPSSSKRRTKDKSGKGKAKAEDEDDDREPTTEEEDSDQEPSIEEDEDSMIIEQPKRRTTNGSAEPAVLDLTDEGDDTASSPAPFASSSRSLTRPSGSRREGDSLFGTADIITADSSSDEDDEKEKKPHSSRRDKGKDKGKARASSSPPPPAAKSPSPAPADASTTVSSVPLGPDGEPLPTLNHLTCPICFGPPAPLALTSCGHAFCAPCLHASLVAGPALTPPPESGVNRGTYVSRGGGHGPVPAHLRGRVVSRGGSWSGGYGGGRGTAGAGSAGTSDNDGDPDLNKHCPVCRTALRGGWGKSLRGLVLRMGPAKKKS